jgi:hypothetical protein
MCKDLPPARIRIQPDRIRSDQGWPSQSSSRRLRVQRPLMMILVIIKEDEVQGSVLF